jgi:cell division protein FtsQ
LRAISVQGHHRLPAREVAEATGLAKAATLDELQLEDLVERLARHPWIRSARVALLPTGTLIVSIEEREARAVLRGAGKEAALLLDEHCVPFASVEVPPDPLLPTLRTATAREAGKADDELCRALALAESVRDLAQPDASPSRNRYARSEVVLPEPGSELGWMLQTPSGEAVILGDGSAELLVGRLANFERLLDSGIDAVERASTIDLRFADQAVLRGLASPDGASKSGG